MVSPESNQSAEFGVSYQGDALASNSMNVRDLAPALLALGEVFDRANLLLNGERATVSLSVRATRPGSFDLLLLLEQVYGAAAEFLTGALVTSAANLQGIIVGGATGTVGLFGLFKWLKGRKATVVEQTENQVTLAIENIRLTIPAEVYRLSVDRDIQTRSLAIVEPLFREGIDRILFKEGNKEIEVVDKDEAPFFGVPSDDDAMVNEIEIPRQVLRLVSPVFQINRKWRLNDGSQTNWYSIRDDKFVQDMTQGRKRFGMGDLLICRIRIVQRVSISGLDTEHEVVQVIEHQEHPRQLSLGGDQDDGSTNSE